LTSSDSSSSTKYLTSSDSSSSTKYLTSSGSSSSTKYLTSTQAKSSSSSSSFSSSSDSSSSVVLFRYLSCDETNSSSSDSSSGVVGEPDLLVAGAGIPEGNGTYLWQGTGSSAGLDATWIQDVPINQWYIQYISGAWQMVAGGPWVYQNTTGGTGGPTAGAWVANDGPPPAPTVTAI
jgi:hypothetical protein